MAVAGTFFSSSVALRRSRLCPDLTSISSAPHVSLFDPAKTVFPSIHDVCLRSRIAFSPKKKVVNASVDGVNSMGSTYMSRGEPCHSRIGSLVAGTIAKRLYPGWVITSCVAQCSSIFGSTILHFFNSCETGVGCIAHASNNSEDANYVPMPIVLIDQESDSDATIVQMSFGDRLGALIDTMKALKDLGLDVAKGTVTTEGSAKQTNFFITVLATGRKVEDPDLLERIRLTIINNLLTYHPESSERLAMGEAFGLKAPEKKLIRGIGTHIHVKEDGPKRSLLLIETADRPGLLLEIIKVIADININVESAEIETEGLVAKDKFHVSYSGAALNSSLSQVLVNCLRYYLRRPETDDESY